MADLDALEDWAGPLLRKLEPAGRAKLARAVAQQLRRGQQQRIQSQRNPDGTPYAPRREHKLREKQGRVKKAKMFQKLRSSSYLKAQGMRAACPLASPAALHGLPAFTSTACATASHPVARLLSTKHASCSASPQPTRTC